MIKKLLIVTALLETATGVALLASPSLPASLLLGARIDSPAALTLGRVAGAALLALGLACWLARGEAQSRAGQGVIAAMLLYNIAAVAVLAHSALGLHLSGAGLWPAVGLHAALAVWCIPCLRVRDAGN